MLTRRDAMKRIGAAASILIPQDYQMPEDMKGSRKKVRPEDLRSGTLYGQYQLRGSVLTIKDASTTASGYMAFGTDMTTIPTSATSGTGIYIDYTGIFGLSSGTQQAYMRASDGKIIAGAGAVTLDVNGISMNEVSTANAYLRWVNGSTQIGSVTTDSNSNVNQMILWAAGHNAGTYYDGEISLTAFSENSNFSRLDIYAGQTATDSYITLSEYSGAGLQLTNNYVALRGTGVAIGSSWSSPSSLLHLKSTAPTFRMEDSTASAKSLLVTTDANLTKFEEAGGAANNLLVLDLANGNVFIGDTSNADITVGLTVNQGANDNQILAFKSSDVAHGITDFTETDTFGYFQKQSATNGGLMTVGISEDVAGFFVYSFSTNENSTRSTSAIAPIMFDTFKKSGSGLAAPSADQNIVTFMAGGSTRFILDSDGDSHQDVGTAWTNFDEHDDIRLLNMLSAHVTRQDDPLRKGFGTWLDTNRAALEKLELVSFNEDGHHFVNMSRLTMLLVGAVRQQAARITQMERNLLGGNV